MAVLGYPRAVPLALIDITPPSGIDLGPLTLGFYGIGYVLAVAVQGGQGSPARGALPGVARRHSKADLDIIVERCLTRAALWDEVKDRLNSLGSLLSGGQQQRLTIARALSQEPEVLMLDEFSIAVDPVTTMRIEDVLKELKQEMTIILVTNLVQQARRLASRTAFFLNGECVEIGETEDLFTGEVKDTRTRDYVEGRFG